MPTDPTPTPSLTPEDITKLTTDLSAEIDAEIKKQLSQPHPFTDTQAKVDQVVNQVEEAKSQPKETLSPPPLKPEIKNNSVVREVEPALADPDPLQASLNSALTSLKEGDRVGDEWILKKIYSTNFGHNHSFFYELENSAGAKWTLSPEEMRDVLKTKVQQTNGRPVDLSPEAQIETPLTIEKNKLDTKQLPQVNSTLKEEKGLDQQKTSKEVSLTKEQIEFIGKLHADSKLWQVFTGFTKDQLSQVQTLYENGQLLKLGIDAHPLLDKISSNNLGTEVEIRKGDTFSSIAEREGHSFMFSNKDSLLLGLHILINIKLLTETAKKAEAAGLIIEQIPEAKEIINLTTNALGGDNSSLNKLSRLLQLLPTNSKFRTLTTEEVKNFEKYFQI